MTTPSDALVVFGVTGDLAFKQIFPALHAMIRRGQLDVPILGVARADRASRRCGPGPRKHRGARGARPGGVRHARRLLRYVDGDYEDPATYEALREALGGAARPAYYLAIPPSLFETSSSGLAHGGHAPAARASSSRSRSAATSRRPRR